MSVIVAMAEITIASVWPSYAAHKTPPARLVGCVRTGPINLIETGTQQGRLPG
jgi:hypothetical protein